MIYDFKYFEPWEDGLTSPRQCLEDLIEQNWVSPADALSILANNQSEPPMGCKQFLIWRAGQGSLASIAREVLESSSVSDDIGRYAYVPLASEWQSPDWQAEHADVWDDATMRMTRPYSGSLNIRRFIGILFEREAVNQIAERWAPDPVTAENDHTSDREPTASSAGMHDRIKDRLLAMNGGNRPRGRAGHELFWALKESFHPEVLQQKQAIAAVNALWPKLPGRPPKA